MQKRIRFVTLFPRARNIDLIKDVGMIPYLLHQKYGYDSTIACYNNGDYLNLKGELKGLKIEFIKTRKKNELWDGSRYLLLNSKDIDILNIYHLSFKRILIWGFIYKLLNPQGILYLKADMDFRRVEKIEKQSGLKQCFQKETVSFCDIVSFESTEIYNRMKEKLNTRSIYLPNGYLRYNKEGKKEKIILTVGRLGTRQKATDVLLEGFARTADKHDYNLYLIGTIEDEFVSYIHGFYEANPQLKERVIFKGPIYDRTELLNEYMAASIFIFPSRWESFGIVLAEAMGCGVYLIMSEQVAPYRDFCHNGDFGNVFTTDNIDELSIAILKAVNKVSDDPEIFERIRTYAQKTFTWDIIISHLKEELDLIERGKSNVCKK